MAVPSGNAHAVRTPLSSAELTTFPIAYVTAERMLNRARVRAGETILVTGASGGLGSALVQLSRVRGARTVALTSPAKAQHVVGLGADIVLMRDDQDWPLRLRDAVGDGVVDVAADAIGGATFRCLLDILRPEGRYVAAGAIAGPLVELDLRILYLKQLELIGSTMGTRKEFRDLVAYIEEGKVRPLLAARPSRARALMLAGRRGSRVPSPSARLRTTSPTRHGCGTHRCGSSPDKMRRCGARSGGGKLLVLIRELLGEHLVGPAAQNADDVDVTVAAHRPHLLTVHRHGEIRGSL